MRKTRRYFLFTLLIAVLGFVSWLLLSEPGEPVYQGKPLRYWLEASVACRAAIANPSIQQKADDAVRQAGTNAIPILLRMLRARDSDLKLKLVRLVGEQHFLKIHYYAAPYWNQQAAEGFRVLRADARGAVPELMQIYEANISRVSQGSASWSLGWIGPDARAANPLLLRTLTNADGWERYNAITTLGDIHAEPELVVPALIKVLQDSEGSTGGVVEALGRFGTNAKPAVPELIAILNGREHPELSYVISEALKQIDPEAAAKAGVK